ncbi:MAG: DUF423 domain-containing protein [Saprospiraceae bacterium]|nr:DUF423 domain-containing protein [Saprospiraceae bacterium]
MNNTFYRRLFAVTSTLGAIGVMVGAFGAHFLKSRLSTGDLDTIKTGVLYLFIHTLATLFVISISKQSPDSGWLRITGITFITGIVMFSGSLFAIGTQSLTGFPASAIGIITPMGGLCFIIGWLSLLLFSLKH